MENNERLESKLGNKNYWDEFYDEEIDQFKNNNELIGEIWFGNDVQKKVIEYIHKKFSKDIKILDLGCGNAAFLLTLFNKGFYNLYGMDYSEKSIELANLIKEDNNINLYVDDISNPIYLNKEFELLHDKGTLDAFMLNKNNHIESYIKYIKTISAKTCSFIITSCNYTKDELMIYFKDFEFQEEIKHKSFSFGGNVGQTVTTLIYNIVKN